MIKQFFITAGLFGIFCFCNSVSAMELQSNEEEVELSFAVAWQERIFEASFSVEAWDGLTLTELRTANEVELGWTWRMSDVWRMSGINGQEQGVDIFNRDGESPIYSLREFWIESPNGEWQVGKQLFSSGNGIEFNFINPNLFGVRDLALSPFDVLNEERRLGDWGVAWSPIEKLQFIAKFAEPPILALDGENPFTRELPWGYYSDVQMDSNWSIGARYLWSTSWVDWEAQIQHGAGNSVIDINVDFLTGEIRPVIAEQTASFISAEADLVSLILRSSAAVYLQSGYEDFSVWTTEAEKIWEFDGGSNLFASIGVATSFDFGSGKSGYSGLDLRRFYEGGAVMATAEYQLNDQWLFRSRGIKNITDRFDGVWLSTAVAWTPTDEWELTVGAQYADGDSSAAAPVDNVIKTEEGTVGFLKLTWTF